MPENCLINNRFQAKIILTLNNKTMQNTYGIILNGVHVDVSKTEIGAKQYATKNGYLTVSIRYNCGYIAEEIAHKYKGKWQAIKKNY